MTQDDEFFIDGRTSTLDEEYQRLGWGEVTPAPWLYDDTENWKIDPLISAHHIGGYHHKGGT